jgi:hypothetical protein
MSRGLLFKARMFINPPDEVLVCFQRKTVKFSIKAKKARKGGPTGPPTLGNACPILGLVRVRKWNFHAGSLCP